jgi:hypothetical protein
MEAISTGEATSNALSEMMFEFTSSSAWGQISSMRHGLTLPSKNKVAKELPFKLTVGEQEDLVCATAVGFGSHCAQNFFAFKCPCCLLSGHSTSAKLEEEWKRFEDTQGKRIMEGEADAEKAKNPLTRFRSLRVIIGELVDDGPKSHQWKLFGTPLQVGIHEQTVGITPKCLVRNAELDVPALRILSAAYVPYSWWMRKWSEAKDQWTEYFDEARITNFSSRLREAVYLSEYRLNVERAGAPTFLELITELDSYGLLFSVLAVGVYAHQLMQTLSNTAWKEHHKPNLSSDEARVWFLISYLFSMFATQHTKQTSLRATAKAKVHEAIFDQTILMELVLCGNLDFILGRLKGHLFFSKIP